MKTPAAGPGHPGQTSIFPYEKGRENQKGPDHQGLRLCVRHSSCIKQNIEKGAYILYHLLLGNELVPRLMRSASKNGNLKLGKLRI
jgi:hypothetical protein